MTVYKKVIEVEERSYAWLKLNTTDPEKLISDLISAWNKGVHYGDGKPNGFHHDGYYITVRVREVTALQAGLFEQEEKNPTPQIPVQALEK